MKKATKLELSVVPMDRKLHIVKNRASWWHFRGNGTYRETGYEKTIKGV